MSSDSGVDQFQPHPGVANGATDSQEVGEKDGGLTLSAEEIGFILTGLLSVSEFFTMPDEKLDDLICVYCVGLRHGQFRSPQFPEIADHSLDNLSTKIKFGARKQHQDFKQICSIDAKLGAQGI